MTNKGINPIFVSALDILTGTLGVFIVLNFLHARMPATPVAAAQTPKPETEAVDKPTTPQAPARDNNGSWWRRTFGRTEPAPPAQPEAPAPKPTQPTQPESPNQPPAPPQDPVAVDLMKQTQGAVVILLQQVDRSKNSVELRLRQGNRIWSNRAGKYQDATFTYQKGLNYFYQKEIQPGTYDVEVRIRRGSKNSSQQPFALFGKIVPPGRRTQTYAFGRYAIGGSQGEWTTAGQVVVGPTGLEFRPRLAPAPEAVPDPTPVDPTPASAPPPADKPKSRPGKWG